MICVRLLIFLLLRLQLHRPALLFLVATRNVENARERGGAKERPYFPPTALRNRAARQTGSFLSPLATRAIGQRGQKNLRPRRRLAQVPPGAVHFLEGNYSPSVFCLPSVPNKDPYLGEDNVHGAIYCKGKCAGLRLQNYYRPAQLNDYCGHRMSQKSKRTFQILMPFALGKFLRKYVHT